MTALAQLATFRGGTMTLPDALRSYPDAELAWVVAEALRAQQRIMPDVFTADRQRDQAGWRWRGDLDAFIRKVNSDRGRTGQQTITGVRAFLADTRNLVPVDSPHRDTWWLPAAWQDVSPAWVAHLEAEQAAEQDRAERSRYAALRPAGPATPETLPLDPETVGGFDPDQQTTGCRHCTAMAPVRDKVALAALRAHEREAHPDEFWAEVTHVCVLGDCGWGAPGAALYAGHLAQVHKMASPAAVHPLTGQALAHADILRPPAPAPAVALAAAPAVTAAPPPAPAGGMPTIADVMAAITVLTTYVTQAATLTAENMTLKTQVRDTLARAQRAEARLAS
jgi:hypothetical protein